MPNSTRDLKYILDYYEKEYYLKGNTFRSNCNKHIINLERNLRTYGEASQCIVYMRHIIRHIFWDKNSIAVYYGVGWEEGMVFPDE